MVSTLSTRQRSARWRELPAWLRILAVVAAVNFFSFVANAQQHGGDAMNGYHRDGHYFVCSHGACTEPSRRFWTYSYYHSIAMWVTQGAVLLGAGLYYISRRGTQTI